MPRLDCEWGSQEKLSALSSSGASCCCFKQSPRPQTRDMLVTGRNDDPFNPWLKAVFTVYFSFCYKIAVKNYFSLIGVPCLSSPLRAYLSHSDRSDWLSGVTREDLQSTRYVCEFPRSPKQCCNLSFNCSRSGAHCVSPVNDTDDGKGWQVK